jgi:hypothetical protein
LLLNNRFCNFKRRWFSPSFRKYVPSLNNIITLKTPHVNFAGRLQTGQGPD